jgi:hypothetical protein
MTNLTVQKNDILVNFKLEKKYKTVNVPTWNGRDSDELYAVNNVETKVFDYTLVKVFKAVPDSAALKRKREALKLANELLEAAYIPRYNQHIEVGIDWEPLCSFEIEDEVVIPSICSTAVIHSGIKGTYPEKWELDSAHFDISGQLHSYGNREAIAEIVFELAVATIDEMGWKMDERYV